MPKREWFLSYEDDFEYDLDNVDGDEVDDDEVDDEKEVHSDEDSQQEVVLKLVPTGSEADKSGSAKDSAKTLPMNSTARGSQPLFDCNMSSINASDGKSQRSQTSESQIDASQDSQSAVKKKKTKRLMIPMRDFVTEDMSDWSKIKSFPIQFQAEILNGKVQICGQKGEIIEYKQRTRITVIKREKEKENQDSGQQKEKKKYSRKGVERNFTLQEGMTYCLTDIPENKFHMIFNETYFGDSMEQLYRHHQNTYGSNWDHTHNKQDYTQNVVLEELKKIYRFLEIMQRPNESNPKVYTSTGNSKIYFKMSNLK